MPLAVKAGLDPNVLVKVTTSGSAKSFASEHFIPKILAGEFCGDFSLSAADKDIQNVQETATELHAMTPVTNAMVAIYQQAIAQGLGEQPKSAMIKVYEQQLGVEFRHDSHPSRYGRLSCDQPRHSHTSGLEFGNCFSSAASEDPQLTEHAKRYSRLVSSTAGSVDNRRRSKVW